MTDILIMYMWPIGTVLLLLGGRLVKDRINVTEEYVMGSIIWPPLLAFATVALCLGAIFGSIAVVKWVFIDAKLEDYSNMWAKLRGLF